MRKVKYSSCFNLIRIVKPQFCYLFMQKQNTYLDGKLVLNEIGYNGFIAFKQQVDRVNCFQLAVFVSHFMTVYDLGA
jgi:hypothetical protein